MRWRRGPFKSDAFGRNGIFGKSGGKIVKLETKIQMRWQKAPLESGDFGQWRIWQIWWKWRFMAKIPKL